MGLDEVAGEVDGGGGGEDKGSNACSLALRAGGFVLFTAVSLVPRIVSELGTENW